MELVSMAERFSVDRLHQEQFEIIRRAQILGDTRLTDSFFPEHCPRLPTQPIPALLVIVHDGTKKIPFEFLKGHGSRLSRCFGIEGRDWYWANVVQSAGSSSERAIRRFLW